MWTVVGSTNFDYRSFSINDEVNLAVMDRSLTRRVVRTSNAIFLIAGKSLMRNGARRAVSVSRTASFPDGAPGMTTVPDQHLQRS